MRFNIYDDDHWLRRFALTASDSLLGMAGGGGQEGGSPSGAGGPEGGQEGGEDAGDGAGGADGSGGSGGEGGDQGASNGAGGEPETVEFKISKSDFDSIPDNFKKDGAFNPPSLIQSWKDQQNRIKDLSAQVKPAVEKPDAYSFKVDESDKGLAENAAKVLQVDEKLGEDPIVHDFREVAHKHNLSQDAFQDIISWYIGRQGPLMDPPIDQKAEMAKLGDNAQRRIDYVDQVRETLKANGTLSEAAYNEFWLTCSSAAGIQLVEALLNQGGGVKVPTDLTPEDQVKSASQLRSRLREITEKRDKNEISEEEANRLFAEVNRDFEKVVGNEQGGTSLVLQG